MNALHQLSNYSYSKIAEKNSQYQFIYQCLTLQDIVLMSENVIAVYITLDQK